MTVEFLVSIVSAILAILFQYFPKLKDWYGNMADNYQRLVMLGMLVLVVGGAYGLSCAHYGDYFTCDTEGLFAAGRLLFLAIATNQTVYKLLPNPTARAWRA
jgi:hypothetical protein